MTNTNEIRYVLVIWTAEVNIHLNQMKENTLTLYKYIFKLIHFLMIYYNFSI